jgi:tetratricopeptide (TPR) repeat protein
MKGINSAMKKTQVLLAIICTLIVVIQSSTVSAAGQSYLYSYTNQGIVDVSAPQAYLTETIHTAQSLGVSFKQTEDMTLDNKGNLYICDSGVNCIYEFDALFKLVRTIDGFKNPLNENPDTFNAPKGICFDSLNNLYIADSGNNRVVVLNEKGNLLKTIENPKETSDVLEDTFQFIPLKLIVDSSNRLFVLCKNVFEGIIQFSESGMFVGFIGSNRVVPSAIELLWKRIMSEEQKGKLSSFVPVEYTNISLDSQGFIYAVTSVRNVENPIRRLNPSGNDVLVRKPINGSNKVSGDALYVAYSDYNEVTTGPSSFVDITSDEYGNFYALDGKRGRVFAYDSDGNMLFVFGALGTRQKGAVESPSAILYNAGKLYILDRSLCQIITYVPTEYAQLIQRAMEAYYQQRYEVSVDLWQQVIRENSYFDLAYVKAGYGLYRLERYDEAMAYFKIANVKTGYSKSFVQYTSEWLNKNFDLVALTVISGVILLAGIIFMARRYARKRKVRF